MSPLLDIRYALRRLFKAPKFTALTLTVLIGGLSISLFTFSFLYSLVYKPLPLPEGEKISRLSIAINGSGRRIPAYEFFSIKEQLQRFDYIGVFDSASVRISIADKGESVEGTYVQAGMFEVTQVPPVLGRTISEEDTLPGASPVTVLSFHTWQEIFNADPNIIGREIRINDQLTSIIGVMPKGYGFPINTRLWLPIPERLLVHSPESDSNIQVFVRVKSEFSIAEAEDEITQAMNVVYSETAPKYQKPEGEITATLLSFPHAQTDGDGNLVFTFFNLIAFFILLLACINTGNLLLAKAVERQKETAVRAALGAPQGRLILSLMWEGIIITLLGGLLSVLLVGEALSFIDLMLHTHLSDNLPFWWHWGMDMPTLLMAIGFIAITILLACYLPAQRAANQDINMTLRDGTRGAQGKKASKISRILVTVQVFLISTLMLIGSLSAFISQYLLNLDFGDDYTQVISASLILPEDNYQSADSQIQFFEQVITQLNQKPNVEHSVSRGYLGESELVLDETDRDLRDQLPKIDTFTLIGNTDFFSARLLEGRHLDQRDRSDTSKTALISDSMRKRYWPNESVINKRINVILNDQSHQLNIVGIVKDRLNESSLFGSQESEDEIYVSGLQFARSYQRIYYRYSGDIAKGEESFFQSLFTVDRTVEPYRVEPASRNLDLMRDSMRLTSFITFAAGGFALLLAVTGIYGLTANTIMQKTHEIGIRRAVGAQDSQIIKMMLKQGSKQLAIGLSCGLLVFTLISIPFVGMTEGKIPTTLFLGLALVVSIGLSIVVMLAIYFPTKKAVELEPNAALRYE